MKPDARALAEVAMEIAKRRAEIAQKARLARLRGDDAEALRLLDRLVGLVDEEPDAQGDRPH